MDKDFYLRNDHACEDALPQVIRVSDGQNDVAYKEIQMCPDSEELPGFCHWGGLLRSVPGVIVRPRSDPRYG